MLLFSADDSAKHQEALARGMLTRYTQEVISLPLFKDCADSFLSQIAGKVVFVSHEWLSLTHADPQGEQLRELQRLLIRMMKGEVVPSANHHSKLSGYLYDTDDVTREEWAASLPFAYVWMDFLSIPVGIQPLAFVA